MGQSTPSTLSNNLLKTLVIVVKSRMLRPKEYACHILSSKHITDANLIKLYRIEQKEDKEYDFCRSQRKGV